MFLSVLASILAVDLSESTINIFKGIAVMNFSPDNVIDVSFHQPPNGLRYLRWGRDGEAVQLEK